MKVIIDWAIQHPKLIIVTCIMSLVFWFIAHEHYLNITSDNVKHQVEYSRSRLFVWNMTHWILFLSLLISGILCLIVILPTFIHGQ